MEIVLANSTPDDVLVVLPAIVYAKIIDRHPAVADLDLIDRTIRAPDARRPDPRPTRERFVRREGRLRVLAVVEYAERPAVLTTAFPAPPTAQKP